MRNQVLVYIASKRFLKRRLGWILPELGFIDFSDVQMRIFLSLKDMLGPSYHLLHRERRFMDYEEKNRIQTLSVLNKAKGDPVFLDIGSNIGLFSAMVANKMPQARVISFDPDPVSYLALTNTKVYNRLGNLEVVPMGLGEKMELRSFYFDTLNHGGHSFDRFNINSGCEPIRSSLMCFQLDSLVPFMHLDRVDLIKVDVQGFEEQVLKGAAGTIKKYRPTLLVECEHKYLLNADNSMQSLFADYVCESSASGERFPIEQLAEEAQRALDDGKSFSDIWFFPQALQY